MSREYDRMPTDPSFRRLAKRANWKFGWSYYATGQSVQGYRIVGMGSSAQAAIADLRKQRH